MLEARFNFTLMQNQLVVAWHGMTTFMQLPIPWCSGHLNMRSQAFLSHPVQQEKVVYQGGDLYHRKMACG